MNTTQTLGLMQLTQFIRTTARRYGTAGLFDLAQPADYVQGGGTHLRHLLDLFGWTCSAITCRWFLQRRMPVATPSFAGTAVSPFSERRSCVLEVTALDGDPSSELHPSVPGLAFSGSGRKFSRVGPTGTGLHPIYSYVDSAGVVHFDL